MRLVGVESEVTLAGRSGRVVANARYYALSPWPVGVPLVSVGTQGLFHTATPPTGGEPQALRTRRAGSGVCICN